MIKLSRLSDYAVLLLTHIARDEGQIFSARDLATTTHLPLPTISKILKALARHQILGASRGAAGGYRLMRPAHSINVAEIIEALDGPIALTSCQHEGAHHCQAGKACAVQDNWNHINVAIKNTLAHLSLLDMTKPVTMRVS